LDLVQSALTSIWGGGGFKFSKLNTWGSFFRAAQNVLWGQKELALKEEAIVA